MYLPSHFEEHNPDVLRRLMADHPLATLIGQSASGVLIEHIPLQWKAAPDGGEGVLIGHVARANTVWQQWPEGSLVTAVFHGPQAYVTPAWYPSKREHGKVVPTWNYSVVHVEGRIHWTQQGATMRPILDALTDQHEAPRAHPWSVNDAPADYTASMMAAVVGLRIEIDRLRGKFKLSQNRSRVDREGVLRGLHDEPDAEHDAMLRLMQDGPGPGAGT